MGEPVELIDSVSFTNEYGKFVVDYYKDGSVLITQKVRVFVGSVATMDDMVELSADLVGKVIGFVKKMRDEHKNGTKKHVV